MPAAGVVNSFTILEGELTSPANMPYEFAALVLHPTGTPNQYTVIYDSGTIDLTQAPYSNADGLHTVSFAPVAVQAGDVIASWGRGIQFRRAGTDVVYYNGSEFNTAKPSGTFTVGASSPYSIYNEHREYALAFNLEVPEPTAGACLLIVGGAGLIRRRRRVVVSGGLSSER